MSSLDPAFDGFRIAMVGDFHGGSNGGSAENIRRIVAAINAENADLIVLLGDYVSEDKNGNLKMSTDEIADALSGLHSPNGVLAVMGNHDWRYGEEKVGEALRSDGYRVLENEVAIVERDGKRLRFLGLQDHMHIGYWQEFSDGVKAVASQTDGTGDLIVLEHAPDALPVIGSGTVVISKDLRLMLAAHTHGGQVWLPILGRPIIPSLYGQKYAYGHVKDYGIDMWVTSGTGTSLLPFRFMVPPEIVVLTLRAP
jgi:predicted MPP superfamily phosphohydrolase